MRMTQGETWREERMEELGGGECYEVREDREGRWWSDTRAERNEMWRVDGGGGVGCVGCYTVEGLSRLTRILFNVYILISSISKPARRPCVPR